MWDVSNLLTENTAHFPRRDSARCCRLPAHPSLTSAQQGGAVRPPIESARARAAGAVRPESCRRLIGPLSTLFQCSQDGGRRPRGLARTLGTTGPAASPQHCEGLDVKINVSQLPLRRGKWPHPLPYPVAHRRWYATGTTLVYQQPCARVMAAPGGGPPLLNRERDGSAGTERCRRARAVARNAVLRRETRKRD
ncbi:hypothetical protein MTO96_018904 [Rhipicephalus appendiculatus]